MTVNRSSIKLEILSQRERRTINMMEISSCPKLKKNKKHSTQQHELLPPTSTFSNLYLEKVSLPFPKSLPQNLIFIFKKFLKTFSYYQQTLVFPLSTSSNNNVLWLKWMEYNYRSRCNLVNCSYAHFISPLPFYFSIFSLCLASFPFYDHFSFSSYFIIKLHL